MTDLYVKKLSMTWKISTIKANDSLLVSIDNTPQSCIALSEALLDIDGADVIIFHKEEDLCDIFTQNGVLYTGKTKLKKMDERHCHDNSSILWIMFGDYYQIVTGFCLDEGMWRRHTWVVDKYGQLIETTFPRERYFGVEVINDEYAYLGIIKQKTNKGK